MTNKQLKLKLLILTIASFGTLSFLYWKGIRQLVYFATDNLDNDTPYSKDSRLLKKLQQLSKNDNFIELQGLVDESSDDTPYLVNPTEANDEDLLTNQIPHSMSSENQNNNSHEEEFLNLDESFIETVSPNISPIVQINQEGKKIITLKNGVTICPEDLIQYTKAKGWGLGNKAPGVSVYLDEKDEHANIIPIVCMQSLGDEQPSSQQELTCQQQTQRLNEYAKTQEKRDREINAFRDKSNAKYDLWEKEFLQKKGKLEKITPLNPDQKVTFENAVNFIVHSYINNQNLENLEKTHIENCAGYTSFVQNDIFKKHFAGDLPIKLHQVYFKSASDQGGIQDHTFLLLESDLEGSRFIHNSSKKIQELLENLQGTILDIWNADPETQGVFENFNVLKEFYKSTKWATAFFIEYVFNPQEINKLPKEYISFINDSLKKMKFYVNPHSNIKIYPKIENNSHQLKSLNPFFKPIEKEITKDELHIMQGEDQHYKNKPQSDQKQPAQEQNIVLNLQPNQEELSHESEDHSIMRAF